MIGSERHHELEYIVSLGQSQRVFYTFDEALAFAFGAALAGERLTVTLDVLVYGKGGADAFGGPDAVEAYLEDPDASVFKRFELAVRDLGERAMTAPRFDLRQGGCLDPDTGLPSLGDESVDVVISDPPYRNTPDFGVGFLDADEILALCRQLARVARRWVVIFTDVESVGIWQAAYLAAGLDYCRTGVWVKPNAAPQRSGDRPACGFEAIVIGHRPGRKRWNGGGHTAVWKCAVEQHDRVHPTQKPVALMEKLVAEFSEPGELICDPYSGGGTTGVAALHLGRRFLGWELRPDFHAAATARLLVAREQLRLFDARPANDVEQTSLFETDLEPKREIA